MTVVSNITEWALFGLVLAIATAVLFWRSRARAWVRIGFTGCLLAVVASAVFLEWRTVRVSEVRRRFESVLPSTGRPGGYVSSDTCRSCHPDQYASWHGSYHRTMTQYADSESVKASFEPRTLVLGGEDYRIWRQGDEFWAEMPDPEWKERVRQKDRSGSVPRISKRIGLLTGSHHMQIFWIPSAVGNQQLIFPFAWLIADRRWVPVHTTFLRDPAIPPTVHVWNVNCLKCHATAGQPRPDRSIGGLNTRVGELGIACESCHGPAENHVRLNQNPTRRYARALTGRGDDSIVNPARLTKDRSSQTCGQCHGIKWIPASEHFSEEGFSFRPGQDLNATTPLVRPSRIREQPFTRAGLVQNPNFLDEHYWIDGMVRVSGREFNGTVESPCFERGEMSCLSCHSMHKPQSFDDQLGVGKHTQEACLQCHSKFRDQIELHTRHKAGSSGSECYNCHMPHTTYGLLKAIRSHQITSPNAAESFKTGRPNACNLCHLDKTLNWSAKALNEWYQQPPLKLPDDHQATAASVVWTLSGDAGQRALMAWHFGWETARSASGAAWIAPFLSELLTDPYSAVRYIANQSIKDLPGFTGFNADYIASPDDWIKNKEAALRIWRQHRIPERLGDNSAVLLSPSGEMDANRWNLLLGKRNNRSMDLQE